MIIVNFIYTNHITIYNLKYAKYATVDGSAWGSWDGANIFLQNRINSITLKASQAWQIYKKGIHNGMRVLSITNRIGNLGKERMMEVWSGSMNLENVSVNSGSVTNNRLWEFVPISCEKNNGYNPYGYIINLKSGRMLQAQRSFNHSRQHIINVLVSSKYDPNYFGKYGEEFIWEFDPSFLL